MHVLEAASRTVNAALSILAIALQIGYVMEGTRKQAQTLRQVIAEAGVCSFLCCESTWCHGERIFVFRGEQLLVS